MLGEGLSGESFRRDSTGPLLSDQGCGEVQKRFDHKKGMNTDFSYTICLRITSTNPLGV